MISFYLRSPDWRQEQAYWAELQAEEDLHEERKREREERMMENDESEKQNSKSH